MNRIRLNRIALILALFVLLPAAAVMAGDASWNTDENGVVLGGYDVVAYFTANEAVAGKARFTHDYEGGTFYFASKKHLSAFQKDPAKYAPQFGGYCAFGVAKNKAKVPVDPATFKIQDGKLLLFFNDMYDGQKVNTKPMWEQSPDELWQTAAEVWPSLG